MGDLARRSCILSYLNRSSLVYQTFRQILQWGARKMSVGTPASPPLGHLPYSITIFNRRRRVLSSIFFFFLRPLCKAPRRFVHCGIPSIILFVFFFLFPLIGSIIHRTYTDIKSFHKIPIRSNVPNTEYNIPSK